MDKYKVLKPIGYGGRQEKGTIIELPEDVANAYGIDYVEKVIDDAKGEVITQKEEKPITKMTVAELRQLAEEMGLDTDGSKADLVERIELAREE